MVIHHIYWIKCETKRSDRLIERKRGIGKAREEHEPIGGSEDEQKKSGILYAIYKIDPIAVAFSGDAKSEINVMAFAEFNFYKLIKTQIPHGKMLFANNDGIRGCTSSGHRTMDYLR